MAFNYLSKAVGRPRDGRRVIINRNGYGRNWPKQRAAAMRRDGYKCVKCGHVGQRTSSGRWDIHVHHLRKISWFVDTNTGQCDYEAANDLSNLMTLCKTCHRAADGHTNLQGFIQLK